MSLSPQSARRTNRSRVRRPVRFASLPCPVCGRMSLADVVEDCDLSGGRLIKQLRHTRCTSCGERFFDVAAMTIIEAARKPSARKRSA